MDIFKILPPLVCLLFLTACTSETAFDLKQEIHSLVNDPHKAPTEISGLQMVLIKNGEIAFEYADGMARREPGHEMALTIDHKVRIASISKFILTLSFMSLVDQGQVDLDADVSDYLGFELRNPNFPDRKITARQILAHISSIRDASSYFMGLEGDFKDFFILGDTEFSADHYEQGKHFATATNQGPGDYFTYSNLNFGIISAIIENVTNKRMDLFVKEKIASPLHLNISFNACDLYQDNFSTLATLYRRGDGGVTWTPQGPWQVQVDGDPISCYYGSARYHRDEKPDLSILKSYQIGKNPTLFSPQGGLRASAKDLAIIMQQLLNGVKNDTKENGNAQIISKNALDQMMTPVWHYDDTLKNGHTGGEANSDDNSAFGMMTTYGLSTHIIDLKDWGLTKESHKFYGHLGSAYGLQGQFWFDPITKDGIVAFVTGLGDDPAKAKSTIPLLAIEDVVLRLALKELGYIN